jgi:hypothetical protein
MRTLCLYIPVFYIAVLAAGQLGWAQTSGTIAGRVTDASGALAPDVTVTTTQPETGLSRSVTSDSGGLYVIPELPVGTWEVKFAKPGFAPFVQRNVLLQVNTSVEVNASLEVAGSTTKVNVSAEAAQVQATSTALVQVVDTRRVEDLPLNGRNVLQLLALTAGAEDTNVPVTYQSTNLGGISSANLYLHTVALNGSRGDATNYLLDNADNNEGLTSLGRPFPNVDAVQEFSVQTSSFDAQYGRGVGGVVNVVTKSGTNAYHGSAFEFLRNYDLNAANFFSGRDALKRNQFGASFGGPIRKDRTFFFLSYQGTRIRSATPGAVVTAPDAAMKAGNFAEWLKAGGMGAIHDPLAPAAYFPDNVIPASRLDPVAGKLLGLMPTSTTANNQVRFPTPESMTNDNQGVARIDHSFNDRHRISGRYFLLGYNNPPVMIPTNVLYATDGQVGYSHSIAFNDSYTFSPKWLNNFTFSVVTASPSRITADTANVTLQNLGGASRNPPGINMLDLSISGWTGMTLGNSAKAYSRSYDLADGVGYANGRHNLRFGGDLRMYRAGFNSYFQSDGSGSFTGVLFSDPGKQDAGNAYAEFLLGQMASWTQTSVSVLHSINNVFSLYAQDDFRVSSRLTLNLGLRYDPSLGLGEESHHETTFVPGQQSTVFPHAPLGLVFWGDKGFENGVIKPYWKSFAPRVGIAWQVNAKTVVRSAYGIFYDEYFGLMLNHTIQAQPFEAQAVLNGPVQLANPYGSAPPIDPVNFTPSSDLVFRSNGTYAVPSSNLRPGYVQNWNFVLEREVQGNLLARAAYVGAKGSHLLSTTDFNPGIFGPGATAANLPQRRPYANIGAMPLGFSSGNSSYNALQLTLQKRYARDFSILASYTFSKSIDYSSFGSNEGNQTGPDPSNTRNNRGPSDFDVTHRFVASGIWEMPKLAKNNAVVRNVLGGWQSNAIFTAQSGTPLTILSGANNSLNGVGGDFAAYLSGSWHLGNRSKQQEIARWFNTSVFTVDQLGTVGTARRGQLRAPGLWNVDYSIFKNFAVTERMHLQLRGEFFNLFNHANLNAPNVTANSPTFGVIAGAAAPRIAQVAAKVIF